LVMNGTVMEEVAMGNLRREQLNVVGERGRSPGNRQRVGNGTARFYCGS
jgi:hypothetical protein